MSSTDAPERIERFFCVTSVPAATKRSLCLMTSQPSLVFTSANEPFSFSPRSCTLIFPSAKPSRTSRCAATGSSKYVAPPSSGEYTPQSHTITSPAPYCFGGNDSFEGRVVERMVLGERREALVGRIERQPLGHRPRLQHAVTFQAQVVVHVRGRMLLDHEEQRARAPVDERRRGFRGRVEGALRRVLREG